MKNWFFNFIIMRKSIFLSLIFALIITSCDQNSIADSSNPTVHDFEKVIESANHGDVAFLVPYENSNESIYWVFDGWEYAWGEESSGELDIQTRSEGKDKIVCKGSGVSFARCVKKYVDDGGCVTVYKKGDTYYAKSTTCPKFVIKAGNCTILSSCGSTIDLLPPGYNALTIPKLKITPTLIRFPY